MEDAGASADIGTLIIVDNFVEADDLKDAFERHRMGPVLHIRSVDIARAMLAETGHSPQLVVVGVSVGAATTEALIAEQRGRGSRVLVLNGPPPADVQTESGTAHLARPYADSDLSRAIQKLMG